MKAKRKYIIGVGVGLAVLLVLVSVLFLRNRHREKEDIPELIDVEVGQMQNGIVLDTQPEDVWSDDDSQGYNGFTTRAQLGAKEGSVGLLTIPKIKVECPVYDSENTMEDMKKGAVHFMNTSYWDGNVALSAHIGNLDYCYFDRLKELKKGDELAYETEFGTRNYRVSTISVISDDDWSMMERCDDNRLTLITCVAGKDNQRLCVQAVEV